MPEWSADNAGQLRLQWNRLEDFIAWLNSTVAPAANAYGYRIVIEPIPKDEVAVDRA